MATSASATQEMARSGDDLSSPEVKVRRHLAQKARCCLTNINDHTCRCIHCSDEPLEQSPIRLSANHFGVQFGHIAECEVYKDGELVTNCIEVITGSPGKALREHCCEAGDYPDPKVAYRGNDGAVHGLHSFCRYWDGGNYVVKVVEPGGPSISAALVSTL